jgi:hypothetical protein
LPQQILKPILLLLALCLVSSAIGETRAEAPLAYRFKQVCKTAGTQEVTVTDSNICVKSSKGGLVALFGAPYREIYLYNTHSKKCIAVPFQKYNSPFSYMWNLIYSQNLADIPLTRPVAVSFKAAGCQSKCQALPGLQFNSTDKYTNDRIASHKNNDLPARGIMTLTYTTTAKFTQTPELGHLLQKMYGLPEVDGVPLTLIYRNFHNEARDYLLTSEVEQVKISAADFSRPTGYAPAQTVEEVTSVVNDGIEIFGR